MKPLIIYIPELPPVEYSQNWRGYWRRRYEAGKRYKQLVVSEVMFDIMRYRYDIPLKSASIKVIYHVRTRRRRDQDNAIARLKPCLDGLVAAGLFKDDEGISFVRPVEFAVGQTESLELQLVEYERCV